MVLVEKSIFYQVEMFILNVFLIADQNCVLLFNLSEGI